MGKRVAVIIKCKLDASSYYRLYQYFGQIKEEGRHIILYEQIPEKVYLWYYNTRHFSEQLAKGIFWMIGTVRTFFWIEMDQLIFRSDILILNRKFYARKLPVILKSNLRNYLKRKILIWDFDDNIIDDKEISKQEFELVSKHSKKIVVTNHYLKEKLSIKEQKKTILLPTTDMDLYQFDYKKSIEERFKSYETTINLLWVGSRNNVEYLKLCISELDQIVENRKKKVVLYVICNREFHWRTKKIQVRNIQWDRRKAIEIMRKCHLGLMPLREDTYTLGKAGFKIVQYFGAAIPALASSVGYNKFIIEEGKNGYLIQDEREWSKIENLMEDGEQWKQFAFHARATYEEKFNPFLVLKQWKEMLNDMERLE